MEYFQSETNEQKLKAFVQPHIQCKSRLKLSFISLINDNSVENVEGLFNEKPNYKIKFNQFVGAVKMFKDLSK